MSLRFRVLAVIVLIPIALAAASETETAKTAEPRARILSDSEAASKVRRSAWEPRPENYEANHRVPARSELIRFRKSFAGFQPTAYENRVTGNFTGTTDEIIQWAAWKWGLDEDIVRAQADGESRWRQNGPPGDGGISYGIMQIKSTVQRGTYPLSSQSTAFNLDWYGAKIRHYYDGYATWLSDRRGGGDYEAGDLWGSIGAYYSGGWHTDAARWYIDRIRSRLADRPWEDPDF